MSSEDILDHGRRIAALERQVSELTAALGGAVAPSSEFTFASDEPASVRATDDPRLHELVRSGNTIEAIKLYRELTGVGLKEAKDAVDGIS